jgi:hypothetical protein
MVTMRLNYINIGKQLGLAFGMLGFMMIAGSANA